MTQTAANQAASKLLRGSRRVINAESAVEFLYAHIVGWGPPKTSKSHFGLAARTTAVYAPGDPTKKDPANPFAKAKGELLIPSKPLRVALLNLDRDISTVLVNLPKDSTIIEERMYLDPQGEPYIMPSKSQVEEILGRCSEFISDVREASIAGETDLFQFDGGTISWEHVRETKLPAPTGKDADGNPHHLPRQYKEPNDTMRSTIMQRIYGLPCNTYMTLEASTKWSSASAPVTDANGNEVLRPAGWRLTDHYADVALQFKLESRRGADGNIQTVRTSTVTRTILSSLMGTTDDNPTFERTYRKHFGGLPLLRDEDRLVYMQAREQYGTNLVLG